jgi:hypothetical protein
MVAPPDALRGGDGGMVQLGGPNGPWLALGAH